MAMDELKYPIGQFLFEGEPGTNQVDEWISEIDSLPRQLRDAVSRLSLEQLDTRYRPGGWTSRQVVHHIGDSHLNSFVRFKWALTEDRPTIKTYFEERWAELGDYRHFSIEDSLDFIEILHKRWVVLLRSLSGEDLKRELIHPDSGPITLRKNVGLYAWHGKHHLAHITSLCTRMNW